MVVVEVKVESTSLIMEACPQPPVVVVVVVVVLVVLLLMVLMGRGGRLRRLEAMVEKVFLEAVEVAVETLKSTEKLLHLEPAATAATASSS